MRRGSTGRKQSAGVGRIDRGLTCSRPESQSSDPHIVVIGSSLDGMDPLGQILRRLSVDCPFPIAVVQHRSAAPPGKLDRLLQKNSALPVIEVEDKLPVASGKVYLAPADYHLLVDLTSFALSIDAPITFSRPSIDVLFQSAADAYGPTVLGVILSGASKDGAAGVAAIKASGGFVVVQDPKTAGCAVMPEAAIAAARIDAVLSPRKIAALLAGTQRRTRPEGTTNGPSRRKSVNT